MFDIGLVRETVTEIRLITIVVTVAENNTAHVKLVGNRYTCKQTQHNTTDEQHICVYLHLYS